ncbi:hypothetical protein HG530_011228 [Fusarium avenaceum]|nr:hypothetical protein HG530_011228 [Fusarium avenaceum]
MSLFKRRSRASQTYVGGLVELEVEVHSGDTLHVLLVDVPADTAEVLLHVLGVGALGDDSKTLLGGPAEEDLGGGLVVLGGEASEDLVLHERRSGLGNVHVELHEASRAEGGVGSHSNALSLGKADKVGLLVVGVKLDLESSRSDLGDLEQVVDGLRLEVGDTDGLGKALLNEALHGAPGLLVGGLAPADLGAGVVVVPAGRVADLGVDVLEGDGEVDEEEIKVVDLPVGELAAGDGLDVLLVMVCLPELGDDEEVLSLHDAFLDGAGNTLTTGLLIAVIC